MTADTRQRALISMQKVRVAGCRGEWYFPRVFVVGEHIYYTFMAAYRQKKAMFLEEGHDAPIEKVECPFRDFVRANIDQKGELMPDEKFPNIEYARLMKS